MPRAASKTSKEFTPSSARRGDDPNTVFHAVLGQPFSGRTGALEVNLSNENVITRIYVRHQSDILKFKDMRQTFYEKFGRSQSQSAYSDEWRKGVGKIEPQ